jgi:hypothetical protein
VRITWNKSLGAPDTAAASCTTISDGRRVQGNLSASLCTVSHKIFTIAAPSFLVSPLLPSGLLVTHGRWLHRGTFLLFGCPPPALGCLPSCALSSAIKNDCRGLRGRPIRCHDTCPRYFSVPSASGRLLGMEIDSGRILHTHSNVRCYYYDSGTLRLLRCGREQPSRSEREACEKLNSITFC